MANVEAVLGARGPLAHALGEFKPRPAQQQMAARVEAALAAREILLVEAGTGTGKTYAYLVPALLSGMRVLISTGTRTLQDQLYHRDLPLLAGAIGRPARVALLKGRSNYLCRARLTDVGRQAELLPAAADPAAADPTAADTAVAAQAAADAAAADAAAAAHAAADSTLSYVLAWSQSSRTGDLAELSQLGDSHPLRAQLSSTRERCTGTRCSEFARCHVFAARRAALEADIVVVNHHLLLADMALKEDGFGDLLPSVDAVILDEAHQLPDLASEFFGSSLSARQVELLLADLRQALPNSGLDAEKAGALARMTGELARSLGGVQALFASEGAREERSLAWDELSASAHEGLRCLEQTLRQLGGELSALAAAESPLQQCALRAEHQASILRLISAGEAAGARTLSTEARGFTARLLPYDISQRFRAFIEQGRAAWVFTSATLAVGEDFGHFASRLGLESASALRLTSPFDYPRQALLYLPRAMPPPADALFTEALLEAALPLIEAAGGGAFLLFTSHRALRRAAALLGARLPRALPMLVQGTAPRELLLRRFRASGNAVLLGCASFWEGVDVQGPALRLVVIDRLPFASPEDPLVRARIEHLKAQGTSPFKHYQLPEAVLALKQGVGRLIRSESDRGVVMICDPRLSERGYGRVFRDSLPPMSVTRDLACACAALRAAPSSVPA